MAESNEAALTEAAPDEALTADDSTASGGRWPIVTGIALLAVGLLVIALATIAFLGAKADDALAANAGGATDQPGAAASADSTKADAADAAGQSSTLTPDAADAPDAPGASAPAETADTERVAISELPDAKWVDRTAAATGIPPRALAAYAGAALHLRTTQPSCGIGWNTLAAIGEVESHHGTIDGGRITDAGTPTAPIYGVPLDGNRVAHLPDTDGGRIDGDASIDRAVGPMQFTPDTWQQYGADGNGDGRADPQQLDDAAFAAATYLCAVGGDLTDGDRWLDAVSAYNAPVDYVAEVAHIAAEYGRAAGE